MAELGLNAKSIWLQTFSSQLFSQSLIVSEVISQMLSHLILPNTHEVEKLRYYSQCFQTGTEMEKVTQRQADIITLWPGKQTLEDQLGHLEEAASKSLNF